MNRRPRRKGEPVLILTLAFFLAAGAGAVAAAEGSPAAASGEPPKGQVRVVFPEVAYVGGGRVTLADVARLEGPQELTERLGGVTLGPAPLPGRSRWLETGYLAVRLRQAGIDPSRVRLEGPDRMELIARPEGAGTTAAPVQPGLSAPATVTVAQGETVVLEAVAGPVVVQAAARVLRAGRTGERVPVVNLSSGREVEAVVVGPGRVRAEVAI